MLKTTTTWTGLTPADFQQAARELPQELARTVEGTLDKARVQMTRLASGPVLRRKSGRTAMALSRAQVSAAVVADGVVGTLRHRGLLLNIHEGGALQPARTIRAKRKKALRFFSKGGGFRVFVHRGALRRRIGATGVITQAARRLPARPIGKPVLDALTPALLDNLAQVVDRLITKGGPA